jgi:3-hydroxybutyryl-CoA dehydrogenase
MAKVTVIGSGLMGSGIAQVTSLGGWDVTLIDTDKGALERARAAIRGSLDRFVAKEKVTAEDAEAAQSRITVGTDLDEAAGSKIVVEAVFERLAVKQEVFRKLSGICAPETVLATNTSAIPITEIAAAATHPERVVGTHFFSPVPMMQLCELVRGIHTSDEALDTARRFAESAGKTCVVVNRDVAGFATTRLICAFVNEAARLVEDGVISAEDLDTACRLGFGHPMGPLATADLTGIDVITHATENIYEDTADPKFFPPALLRRLVAAGEIGRKSGKGFFDYSELSTGLWIYANGADPQVRAVFLWLLLRDERRARRGEHLLARARDGHRQLDGGRVELADLAFHDHFGPAVGGHDHGLREARREVGEGRVDPGALAPLAHRAGDEPHRVHAVGDHVGQPGGLGRGFVLVDRVLVPGGVGVGDEVGPRDRERRGEHGLARFEPGEGHAGSPATNKVVHTSAARPSPSATSVRSARRSFPATDLIDSMVEAHVTAAPARSSRWYAKRCSRCRTRLQSSPKSGSSMSRSAAGSVSDIKNVGGTVPSSSRPRAWAKRVTESAVMTTGSVGGKDRPAYEVLSMYRSGGD